MDYKNVPPIPPSRGTSFQFGLAGPVSGSDGNFVMVAGGANFENGMPWQGGVKSYHDEIYLLEENPDGVLSWKECMKRLPVPMAYSACVTIENGFVSLGGENETGALNSVFRYTFADGDVKIESLPDLPQKLSACGAASIKEKIYVTGGVGYDGASSACYALSLQKPGEGWIKLPDLPTKLSHAVVVSQQDGVGAALYVIGGRVNTTGITTFLSTVYKFSPAVQRWKLMGDIALNGMLMPLAAGTGFSVGSETIVLFGGDRGVLFNQTERMNFEIAREQDPFQKRELLEKKEHFLTAHPGFSREVLTFNTRSGTWTSEGEMTGVAPVTTVAFPWKGKIVIPSGEIRPGIRTDKVILLGVSGN